MIEINYFKFYIDIDEKIFLEKFNRYLNYLELL